MGWTFHDKYNSPRTYAEEKREIENLFTATKEAAARGFGYEVLQASKVGSVWYVATRIIGSDNPGAYIPDSDGSYVVGFVFLTRRSQGWGYKDMDECMGPCEAKAPASLLRKLSPLDKENPRSEYAIKWRANCEAYAARYVPKVGDRVKLAKPVQLQNGTEIQFFDVVANRCRGRNRKLFVSVENLSHYNLQGDWLLGATKVN